jgi:hypothetical protein
MVGAQQGIILLLLVGFVMTIGIDEKLIQALSNIRKWCKDD